MGFIIWLVIGIVLLLILPGLGIWYLIISALIWGYTGVTDSDRKERKEKTEQEKPFILYDRVYANGVTRVENISKTGYYYSDGSESWVDIAGDEHRDNGEIVMENAYIPGRRDIYKDNKYIGYEYEDACGVTQRSK